MNTRIFLGCCLVAVSVVSSFFLWSAYPISRTNFQLFLLIFLAGYLGILERYFNTFQRDVWFYVKVVIAYLSIATLFIVTYVLSGGR